MSPLPAPIEKACEEIEAELFLTDTFHDMERLAQLDKHLRRWAKESQAIKLNLLTSITND